MFFLEMNQVSVRNVVVVFRLSYLQWQYQLPFAVRKYPNFVYQNLKRNSLNASLDILEMDLDNRPFSYSEKNHNRTIFCYIW